MDKPRVEKSEAPVSEFPGMESMSISLDINRKSRSRGLSLFIQFAS